MRDVRFRSTTLREAFKVRAKDFRKEHRDYMYRVTGQVFKNKLSEALDGLQPVVAAQSDAGFVAAFTGAVNITLPAVQGVSDEVQEVIHGDDGDTPTKEQISAFVKEHNTQERNYQYDDALATASFTTYHRGDTRVVSRANITTLPPVLEFVKEHLSRGPSCNRGMDGVIRRACVMHGQCTLDPDMRLPWERRGSWDNSPPVSPPHRPVSKPIIIVHFTSHVWWLNQLQLYEECYVTERDIHCHTDLDSRRWMFSLSRELEPGTSTNNYSHLTRCELNDDSDFVAVDNILYGNKTNPIRKCRETKTEMEFFLKVPTLRFREGYGLLNDEMYVSVAPTIDGGNTLVPFSHQARVFIRATKRTSMLKDGSGGVFSHSFDTKGGLHVCLRVGTKLRLVKKEESAIPIVGQEGQFFVGTNYLFDLI